MYSLFKMVSCRLHKLLLRVRNSLMYLTEQGRLSWFSGTSMYSLFKMVSRRLHKLLPRVGNSLIH